MRKNIIVIGLLLIFLFNLGGYYIWYAILQWDIRQEVRAEIKKGLKEKDLCLISLPLKDENTLHWEEKGKEFRFEGNLYDVVKTKVLLGKRIYYCINDKKERELIAHFQQSVQTKKEQEKRLRQSIDIQYLSPKSILISPHLLSERLYFYYALIYRLHWIDIQSPPPKWA